MNCPTVELGVPPGTSEPLAGTPGVEAAEANRARATAAISEHYEFLWRSVRRLGVPEASVEDAAQQVLVVFVRRIADIQPGAERSFLFATAIRVVADLRKKAHRSPELPSSQLLEIHPDQVPSAETQIDRKRVREVLDRALDDLPEDLRAIFILFEFEDLTMAAIAGILQLAPGTVASRLRRARAAFENSARRLLRSRGFRSGQ
jgi:RNA polymerase sigma-70 factor, ECF subfamily